MGAISRKAPARGRGERINGATSASTVLRLSDGKVKQGVVGEVQQTPKDKFVAARGSRHHAGDFQAIDRRELVIASNVPGTGGIVAPDQQDRKSDGEAEPSHGTLSGAVPRHRLPLECHRFQPLRHAYDIDWLGQGLGRDTAIPGRSGGDVRDAPTLEANDTVDADVIPAGTAPAQRNEDHSLCPKVYRWEEGSW